MEALIRAILARLALPANGPTVYDLGNDPNSAKSWFRFSIEQAMGTQYGEAADKLVATLQERPNLAARIWAELTTANAGIVDEIIVAACPPARRHEERREERPRDEAFENSIDLVTAALKARRAVTPQQLDNPAFRSIIHGVAGGLSRGDFNQEEATRRIVQRFDEFDFDRQREQSRTETQPAPTEQEVRQAAREGAGQAAQRT
jgi:hypothetical protein